MRELAEARIANLLLRVMDGARHVAAGDGQQLDTDVGPVAVRVGQAAERHLSGTDWSSRASRLVARFPVRRARSRPVSQETLQTRGGGGEQAGCGLLTNRPAVAGSAGPLAHSEHAI